MGNYAQFECAVTSESEQAEAWECFLISKYSVPLFWLALFDEQEFQVGQDEEGEAQYFCVTDLESARRRFREREPFLRELFLNLDPYLDFWQKVLEQLPAGALRIELTEILLMSEEGEEQIRLALQALHPQSPPNEAQRAALFGAASRLVDLYSPIARSLEEPGLKMDKEGRMQLHSPQRVEGMNLEVLYALAGAADQEFMAWPEAEALSDPPTPSEASSEIRTASLPEPGSQKLDLFRNLLLLNLGCILFVLFQGTKIYINDQKMGDVDFEEVRQKFDQQADIEQLRQDAIRLSRATEHAARGATLWRQNSYRGFFGFAVVSAVNLFYVVPSYLQERRRPSQD